jgi:WD40 repeat protein/cellulose biosynthesis protein BcsQ
MSARENAPKEEAARPGGRIITFYSYKGGTGRTMLLANVAWILASNKKRVLVVDWDLEAPGLHRYFRPFLADPDLVSSPGVIDLVTDHAVTCMAGVEGAEEEPIEASILPFACSLRWPFDKPGTLDFVSAGKQGPSYAARVNSFNWQSFYDRHAGGEFLEALGESMRAEYDYVLIDSRTGVSDTAGICTVQLPDALVVCFTLNNQSIEGASAVAKSVLDQRGGDFRVYPVPTRVEDGEKRKLERARDHARAAFRDLLGHVDPAKIDQYWGRVEVPYKIFYAYEEILATFGDRPEQLASLLAAAERLTGYLTGGEVLRLAPPGDEERRRVITAFERAQMPGAEATPAAPVSRREASKKAEAADDEGVAEAAPATERPSVASAQPASAPPPHSEPRATQPVSSWRRWALGALITIGSVSAVVALTLPHGAEKGDHRPTSSSTPSSEPPDDADAAATPAQPTAIAAALEAPQRLDPVDKVALVLAMPEGQPPPAKVVAVAQELSKGPLPIAVLDGHTRDIAFVRVMSDGKRVVTAGADGLVRVWPTSGRGAPRTLDWGAASAERRVYSLDVAPGLVAASTDDGDARIWLVGADGDLFFFPFQHVDRRRSIVALSADGATFVRAFEYGEAHVWKLARSDKSFVPEKLGTAVNTGAVQSIEFAADGTVLLRAPDMISVWKDLKGRTRTSTGLAPTDDFRDKVDVTVTMSARGDGVVGAGSDGTVLWWRLKAAGFERPPVKIKLPVGSISALAVDGDRCVLGTADGAVYLWKRGDAEATKLGAHAGRVNAIAFGKNGKLVVTAGADGIAVIRDLDAASAAAIALGKEGGSAMTGVALSTDGDLAVTVTGKLAQVWRLNAPSPAPATWQDAIGYLRNNSSVRLSNDRLDELLKAEDGGARQRRKSVKE